MLQLNEWRNWIATKTVALTVVGALCYMLTEGELGGVGNVVGRKVVVAAGRG